MAHYYKVPAIYEYAEPEEQEERESELTRGEKEIKPEPELISIHPDIPPGHSYICELLDDGETFFVKSEKPIRFNREQEARVDSLRSLSDARSDAELSHIDTARVKLWHAGRRR